MFDYYSCIKKKSINHRLFQPFDSFAFPEFTDMCMCLNIYVCCWQNNVLYAPVLQAQFE